MTSAAKKLLDQVLSLPEEDRRLIGEALLDSVPVDEEIQQAWEVEALRRGTEVERGEGRVLDLDDALAQLRIRLAAKR